MAISCGHCGGTHDTPTDVRSCALGHRGPGRRDDVAAGAGGDAPGVRAASVTPVVPAIGATRDHVALGAGSLRPPSSLGRVAVVRPGADAPAGWEDAPRVQVTADADPDALVETLRDAADRRTPMVVELDELAIHLADPDRPPAPVVSVEPHDVDPWFELTDETLHHLVWSNAVDLRDPERPRWGGMRGVLATAGLRAGGRADVVLPDGAEAWVDAGPVRVTPAVDGVAVVHLRVLEHAGVVPPGPDAFEVASAHLAPDQVAAVAHPTGTARIVAPAGSGKTRVLTERARHLLRGWHLPAGAVTLVAFNKRAQEEMVARTPDLPGLHVRTLNALALAIVNGTPPFASLPGRVSTIDEVEVRRILSRLVDFPRRRNTDPAAPWIEALSQIRLGLMSPGEVERRFDGDVDGLVQVWPRYRAELERAGAVDFDGQIHRALELLLTEPEVRDAARRACRVLLVDEFQDLTPAHVLMIRLLAGPAGSVFGVGDDDQTIYGYQGADPAWLIEFDRLFPGAGDHPLEVNYRCPADVVEVVDRLLRHNRRRVPKVIRAGRPGGSTRGWSEVQSNDPVADTVTAVRAALDGGATAAEVAVLTRVNATLAPVQVALGVAGVPVQGGVGTEFLERTSVRAVCSWLRLALGGWSADDLREALRRPSRPLPPRVVDWVVEQDGVDGLVRLAARLRVERESDRVASFAADLATAREMTDRGATTAELVSWMVDDLGLAGAVATLDDARRGMNRAAQGDDLTSIRALAALHETPRTFVPWVRERLAVPRDPDGVMLATVHRVKGQEWPHVVVHLAGDEQFPHRLADDHEEERRLFHVAITRASQHVRIVTGPAPSPFVDELTNEPRPEAAGPPGSRAYRSSRRAGRDGPTSGRGPLAGSGPREAAEDPLARRDVVPVSVGTVLVDQGTNWTVTEVTDGHVLAASGVAVRRFAIGERVQTIGRRRGSLHVDPDLPPAAVVAFDLLREYRERVRGGKPAYTVFDDRTLAGIARARPEEPAALARVRGVGPAKLEQYGDDVLDVVAAAVDAVTEASAAEAKPPTD